jgi:Tfp pilus assembly protein FimV
LSKKMTMNDQDIINFKLELARAWINNGQEDLAKDLVRSIIERAEGKNDSL